MLYLVLVLFYSLYFFFWYYYYCIYIGVLVGYVYSLFHFIISILFYSTKWYYLFLIISLSITYFISNYFCFLLVLYNLILIYQIIELFLTLVIYHNHIIFIIFPPLIFNIWFLNLKYFELDLKFVWNSISRMILFLFRSHFSFLL